MTGNVADLAGFAALAREHDAILYVDDAHGFGVIGERSQDETSPYGLRGNSIVRYFGESYENIVLVAGLSKAYSSLAAFIACPPEMKRLLKTAAPPYLYSGPSPVASLATTIAGLEVNDRRGDELRTDLWRKTQRVLDVPRRARRAHAEPVRLPDHRGAARTTRADRRGRQVPVRARHLRDAGRVPARAAETRSASGSSSPPPTPTPRSTQLDRRARPARERLRPAACRSEQAARMTASASPATAQPSGSGTCRDGRPDGRATCSCRRSRATRPLINVIGLSVADRDRGRHAHAPPEGAARLVAASRRAAALRRRRLLHVHLSRAARRQRRLPVGRRRHLPRASIRRCSPACCCSSGAATRTARPGRRRSTR